MVAPECPTSRDRVLDMGRPSFVQSLPIARGTVRMLQALHAQMDERPTEASQEGQRQGIEAP